MILLLPLSPQPLLVLGQTSCSVFKKPRVLVLATGDEVVAPGTIPLPTGKLYASNAAHVACELQRCGNSVTIQTAGDSVTKIRDKLEQWLPSMDSIVTTGGVWGSERDCVISALSEIPGFTLIFHRVAIGPGKSAAFGLVKRSSGTPSTSVNIPIFCLPGSPPSSVAAFTVLAMPGLARLRGCTRPPFLALSLPLLNSIDLKSKGSGWTQVIPASIQGVGVKVCSVHGTNGKLASFAQQDCFVVLEPERSGAETGELVNVLIV